jgi:hypothetical protein
MLGFGGHFLTKARHYAERLAGQAGRTRHAQRHPA